MATSAKFVRLGFVERLDEFADALFAVPLVAERVLIGDQFNCFERGPEDDDLDDDDREFLLCLGPLGRARFICNVTGKDSADLIEKAMKVATEAFRERAARSGDK